MNGQVSFFDCFNIEGYENHKAVKSDDWKWSMKDGYPKQSNGLKVFSCFACGGGVHYGL